MIIDIFLDRDGTLIKDPGYISSRDDVEVINGVIRGLKLFKSKGYRLHIVSNQSGVPRGKISALDFIAVESYVNKLFFEQGLEFDSFNYCFHLPTDGCNCRKPKIGLFQKVSQEYGIEKVNSVMLGNSDVDEAAAKNFGIPFWKVGESEGNFFETAREVVRHFEGI